MRANLALQTCPRPELRLLAGRDALAWQTACEHVCAPRPSPATQAARRLRRKVSSWPPKAPSPPSARQALGRPRRALFSAPAQLPCLRPVRPHCVFATLTATASCLLSTHLSRPLQALAASTGGRRGLQQDFCITSNCGAQLAACLRAHTAGPALRWHLPNASLRPAGRRRQCELACRRLVRYPRHPDPHDCYDCQRVSAAPMAIGNLEAYCSAVYNGTVHNALYVLRDWRPGRIMTDYR